jgi:hypothetical protein
MKVKAKKAIIENVTSIVFDHDYDSVKITAIALVKEDGEVKKVYIPIDNLYEVQDERDIQKL